MAGHLLRLSFRSLAGSLREERRDGPWRQSRILLPAALTAAGVLLIVLLWDADAELRRTVAVLAGSGVSLTAFLLPLFAQRREGLHPAAFVLAGIGPRRAAWLSLLGGAVTLPSLGLAAVLAAGLGWWRDDPDGLLVAGASAACAWGSAVLLSRLGERAAERWVASRLVGDAAAAAAMVALLVAAPAIFLLLGAPRWQQAADSLHLITELLSWTPLGAAWSADPARLLIAAAALLLLLGLWLRVGGRVAVGTRPHGAADRLRLGVLGTFGSTPARAIAARTLFYWVRDRRYLLVFLAVILVPALAIVPLAIVGVDPLHLALLPVPLFAFFLGWALHNDLAFDSTALWLHITAAMPGRDDRLGRALPTLAVGSVLVLLGSAATVLLTGQWLWALAQLGVSLCLLLTGTGASSVSSVLFPYPVARPGDSPLSQPVRSWGAALWIHPAIGLLILLVSSPSIALGLAAVLRPEWWWSLAALGSGVVLGGAALRWGIIVGGRAYDRRTGELMTFALSA